MSINGTGAGQFSMTQPHLPETIAEEAARRKSKEFEAREEAFEILMKKEISERRKLADLVEELRKEIEQLAEFRQKQDEFEVRVVELHVKERKIEEKDLKLDMRLAELNKKEKEIDDREKRCREIECILEQSRLREAKLEEELAEFKREKAEFEVRVVELNAKEREIDEKVKQCRGPELMEKKLEERFNRLSKRMDELELKRVKDLESIEKKVEMMSGETLVEDKRPAKSLDHSSEANIRRCVITSGKDLQIFMNEHADDYDSVKYKVESALKLSSDPAKLVLDAMEGFYPPRLKKGGVEFEEAVVRNNCLMVLEWVTKMSPLIEPTVEKEAKELAFDWKNKMKSDAEHSLEVVAFLQLLAAFELANCFWPELEKLLGIVAHCSQAPLLLRELDFADEMTRLIQEKLIGHTTAAQFRDYRAQAAELIAAFELDTQFPHVPESKRTKFKHTPLVGNNGAALKISGPMSSSNTVLSTPESKTLPGKCIGAKRSWSDACSEDNHTGHRSPSHLPDRSNVTAQQAERSSNDQAGCNNPISINSGSEQEKENEGKSLPRISSFVPQYLKGCDMYHRSLVDKIENNKLQCVVIADALRLASDPTEFVLGVVKNPSTLDLKAGRRSVCLASPEHGPLLLLNYLWKRPRHVKPIVTIEALSYAKAWRAKLAQEMDEGMEGVCFLLFLIAYRLDHFFGQDELFSVFGREEWWRSATPLLRARGFRGCIPVRQFIGYLVGNKRPLDAMWCMLQANTFVPSDPPASDRLLNYLSAISKTCGSSKPRLEDLIRELAVWRDVVKHNLADETCKAYILDLVKRKQKLECENAGIEPDYSSTLAPPQSKDGPKTVNKFRRK
ncbi:FRIGIDA-like protein 3 [Linum grandiflorum]